MFTKKTRVMSAIVTVCMLLSLLAGFAAPVSAESNYDEIVPVAGLVDASALDDIKGGLKEGVLQYKVTDREGMNMIAALVVDQTFLGYTFIMANDIDMGKTPFVGIGTSSNATASSADNLSYYTFRGTFDGNGFVFKNLYVSQTTAYGVGLFANCDGATIKNVGIASGLIVGAGYTGSIVGLSQRNTKVINCWNAATVVGGSNTAVGGLVGVAVDGTGSLENSYNMGLIFNYANSAAGLVGQVAGTNSSKYVVKNSYSAGTIVDGISAFNANSYNYFGAILRPADAASTVATESSDNYYLDTIGKPGWEMGEAISSEVNDGATSFSADEFEILHEYLNIDLSSTETDYTVAYDYSTAGYPVLTYSKGGNVVAKRLPAADAKNLIGNDWAAESELFAAISAKAQSGFSASSIEIDNANDLFVLGILASWNDASYNFGLANVTITADIDMDDLTIADVDYYIPLGCNANVKFVLDGAGHTIKNWSSYAYLNTCYVASGGFVSLLAGGTVKNISLEDAYSAYDLYYKTKTSAIGYSYPALLVERVRDAASTIIDCSATGKIEIFNPDAANDNNNAGILGRYWGNVCSVFNSWCEATAVHSYADTPKVYSCRAIGSANTAPAADKFANNYWFSPAELNAPHTGASDNKIIDTAAQECLTPEQGHSEDLAVILTEASAEALWTVKMIGGVKRLCRAADESETIASLYYQKYIPTPTGYTTDPLPYGEPEFKGYFMRGIEITPEPLAGYELDNDQELPVTISGRTVLNFYMIAPDYAYVDSAREMLAQFDPDLYGEEGIEIFAKLEAALDAVDAAAGKSDSEQIAAIYAVMLHYDAADAYMKGGNMSVEYPNLPSISEYETYKNAGITDWAIKTKEDWVYFANTMAPAEASVLRVHLTNDIDMENTNVKPVAYGVGFNGLIDGHGYCFKNFKMEHADANNLGNTTVGDEVSWGLVSYLNAAGVIQNVGIASGSMKITDIGSQEQGVGAIAGVSHDNSKIINCWNGMSIHAVNKNSPSRVGGIVGRAYGVLYGCYNWGTVTGNSAYTHGLVAYGRNGAAKFYNCYSLPSQDTNKSSTAAIGQGGSYVTNASAKYDFYNNTWSVANYLLFDTGKYVVAAINDFSKKHTLTWEQYESGEMAYTMNAGYAALSGVDPVYWTLNEDGQTVHGTTANAVRKLQVTISGEGVPEKAISSYVNGDAVVDLDLGGYEVIDTKVTLGKAKLSGGMLTMQGEDVIISVTVACSHEGTASYTQNPDGTHNWSCSACGRGGTNVVCEKVGEWTNDAVAGKHSGACVCGRVFTEDCAYTQVRAQATAGKHDLYCVCGDHITKDCAMAYELIGDDAHRHYCIDCGVGETADCVLGDWVYTKAPTHEEKGAKSSSCICGRAVIEEIEKLSGATVMAEAGDAYAGEQLAVSIKLKNPENITAKNLVVKVYYDTDVLTYVENQTVVNTSLDTHMSSPGDGFVTFTIGDADAIPADVALMTPKFAVAKTAADGKAMIRVEVVDADAEVKGTFTLVDVFRFAWGDANGDKRTTIADVVMMLRYINGESGVTINVDACDVWNSRFGVEASDGKVETPDAVLILKYIMGTHTPTL